MKDLKRRTSAAGVSTANGLAAEASGAGIKAGAAGVSIGKGLSESLKEMSMKRERVLKDTAILAVFFLMLAALAWPGGLAAAEESKAVFAVG